MTVAERPSRTTARVAGESDAARPKAKRTSIAMRLWSVSGVLVLVLAWEFLPRLASTDDFPTLGDVLGQLAQLASTPRFWEYVASTMRTWAVGLVVAVVAGIVVGFVIGLVPGARRYAHSLIEFLRPIPSVALIPAVILLFGTKYESGVVLILYAAFWPMLLQTLFGLSDIDTVARDTARTFRFSRLGYIRSVVWPSLLPHLFTGVRLAASIALVLAITGEMVIGTVGIGQGIAIAQSSGATTTVYALVLVAGVLGVIINLVARVAERRVLWWHPMIRNASKER